MFVGILIYILFGVGLGIVLGLIPGLHPNMVVFLIPFLFTGEPLIMVAMLTALAVSNSIADFIPSIYFSAPDEGKEFSLLPSQVFLQNRAGHTAVVLAVTGSLISVLILVLLFPLIAVGLPVLYSLIKPVIWILLSAACIWMIWKDRRLITVFCFASAAALGIMLQRIDIKVDMILLPVFSGFFAVSMIVFQLSKNIEIKRQDKEEKCGSVIKPAFFGTLSGIISGFLPGLGSSQVAGFFSSKNRHSFMVTLGALVTSNILISIISLWLIQKSRSGIAVAISSVSEIQLPEVLVIISASLVAVGLASLFTLNFSLFCRNHIHRINYRLVISCILVFIVYMVSIFTGLMGLLVLVTCFSLGFLVIQQNVQRGLLMAVLIVPTILYFVGI
ncbi:MAG: tripartite tricarboxylate transporter permease [Candidatus Aenigmarchaeota archaeon]|nr:tripartite tricarboxylate transporter permease [Candidatus Aenigmarchaeota archaeon]